MKTKVILSIVFVCIFIFLLTIKLPFLTISSKNNLTYKMIYVSKEDMFSLSYIHSVEKTTVKENYRIGDEYSLILDSTIFESQGAGLPFDYPGINIKVSEGKFIFENINQSLKEIPIIPHEISKNSLEIFGKIINLWGLNNIISPCIIKVEQLNIVVLVIRMINKLLHNLW